MNTYEFLNIMKTVEENDIDKKLFKRLIKLMESKSQIFRIFNFIRCNEFLTKRELFKLFLDLYEKDIIDLSEDYYFNQFIDEIPYLPKTMEYIKSNDCNIKKALEIILNIPDLKLKNEDLYHLYENKALDFKTLEELEFYNEILTNVNFQAKADILNAEFNIDLLLDTTITICERRNLFELVVDYFNDLVDCYDAYKINYVFTSYRLFGYDYASTLKEILDKTFFFAAKPKSREEADSQVEVYKFLLDLDIEPLINFFKNGFYSKEILFDESIPIFKRQCYFTLINSSEIIFKDELVKYLINLFETKGYDFAMFVSYMLRNNGIRTNPLCKNFILQEEDINVLKTAYGAFKINRVRKDKELLTALNSETNRDKKMAILDSLIDKYPRNSKSEADFQIELERKLEKEILSSYKLYMKNKLSFDKLKAELENIDDKGLALELTL